MLQKEFTSYGIFVVIANAGLCLTYSIPEEFQNLVFGTLCLLPLKNGKNNKTVVGIFLKFCEKPSFKCVPILNYFPFKIEFSNNHFKLLEWVSEYYLMPIEKTLQLLAPSFIWNVAKHSILEKRILAFENEKNKKIIGEMNLIKNQNFQLNEEQIKVTENILQNRNKPTLLFGVTGSGKTEVYLKLAQKVLSEGKTVLILVPEIALTPQMSVRFRSIFENKLAVLHSGLSQMDYIREWLKIQFGTAQVVLGVRTGVFAPLQNCGLIVVDEEHDSSYKCSEAPCYNARDVAVIRAKMDSAICVLGSATPSLESFYNAKNLKYNFVEIKNKFTIQKTTSLVINAKEELQLNKQNLNAKFLKASFVDFKETGLCNSVVSALSENKKLGEQSMILINRRGYHNYALCSSCATTLTCPNCSISTTLHQKGSKEICHYCGFSTQTRKICPTCGDNHFIFKGIGTQNIEENLKEYLPQLNIDRLDRDTITSNSRLTTVIEKVKNGQTDCLIGTQLLAKGHDFSNVTLVIILHIEDSLLIPDFRAAERTFQLITQSMGRAGRGEKQGHVILQSFIMNHPVVELALKNDFYGFFERELKLRQLAWHPPFSRQILFEIQHTKLESAQQITQTLRELLTNYWAQQNISQNEVRLAGPYQASIEKINSHFRLQLCLQFIKNIHPKKLVPQEIWNNKEFARCLKIDVDPLSFL